MPISVIDGTGDGLAATTTALARARADVAEVVIEGSGLRMSYDGFEAVRGIDLRVSRGQILAFLGPNGAGRRPPSKSSRATANAPPAT
jgi:ATPase subunit of ABC transporter with duplicated ATPase domains